MKHSVVVAASAARTATTSWTFNTEAVSGLFFINITAKGAAPSVTFTIAGVDPASDVAYTILASAALGAATGQTVLRVHPEITAAANTIAKDYLPQVIKITATAGNADSLTYSIGFVGVGQ